MRRFFPKSLTAQFTWLMALVMVLVLCLATMILGSERGRAVDEARLTGNLERLVALVDVLQGLSPQLRTELIALLPTRPLRAHLTKEPVTDHIAPNPESQQIAKQINELWPDTPAPDLGIAVFQRGPHKRTRVHISVQVDEATWLNLRLNHGQRHKPPLFLRVAVTVPLVVSFIGVLVVGIIFIRRLNRPLERLSAAALKAGEGDRQVRVDETGPRELRTLAKAFNTMQEKLKEGDEERARTVAAIGHDLRTPITGLRLRAEMLDDDAERDAMVRLLDQMTGLADGLLAWGRFGSDAEERTPFDLAAMLRELCAEPRFAAPYEGPEILILDGQRRALFRAFGNVLDNARRYGTDPRVALSLNDQGAQIQISDKGPGIPKDKLGDITKPYIRGEESRSTETGGTGLGLAIVDRIIRAHGGHLTINSELGHGTTVSITLPLAETSR